MAFEVGSTVSSPSGNEIPEDLNPGNPAMALTESDAVRTRRFVFERQGGEWTISRHTWAEVVNSGFAFTIADPGFEDVEIWEFENKSGGWNHPIHAHLTDFKVLSRNGEPPFPWELGPKDTVYLGENQLIRVVLRFEKQRGKYMLHCHNTGHEDHDMMTQFEVGEGGPSPFSAPPRGLPAPPLVPPGP